MGANCDGIGTLPDMDEKDRLSEQAERRRRIAEKINEPTSAAALGTLAEEYEREAEAVGEPNGVPEQDTDATGLAGAHESALTILREFEDARTNLIGKGVVLSDGKAGTIDKVFLDELHGLRITIDGHEGRWPISTVKLAEHPRLPK